MAELIYNLLFSPDVFLRFIYVMTCRALSFILMAPCRGRPRQVDSC